MENELKVAYHFTPQEINYFTTLDICRTEAGFKLTYLIKKHHKVRSVVAKTIDNLNYWIKKKLIKDIEYKQSRRNEFLKKNLSDFNALNVGDIVVYSIGFNCTLYQFAKVVKKTLRTVTYQQYEYRGMDCTAKLEQLALTDEFFTCTIKSAKTNKYNPAYSYDNNSD